MAVPKKKMSRTRRNRRRAHEALGRLHLVTCPTCSEMMRPHVVCQNCGTFRGVEYVEVDEEIIE